MAPQPDKDLEVCVCEGCGWLVPLRSHRTCRTDASSHVVAIPDPNNEAAYHDAVDRLRRHETVTVPCKHCSTCSAYRPAFQFAEGRTCLMHRGRPSRWTRCQHSLTTAAPSTCETVAHFAGMDDDFPDINNDDDFEFTLNPEHTSFLADVYLGNVTGGKVHGAASSAALVPAPAAPAAQLFKWAVPITTPSVCMAEWQPEAHTCAATTMLVPAPSYACPMDTTNNNVAAMPTAPSCCAFSDPVNDTWGCPPTPLDIDDDELMNAVSAFLT